VASSSIVFASIVQTCTLLQEMTQDTANTRTVYRAHNSITLFLFKEMKCSTNFKNTGNKFYGIVVVKLPNPMHMQC